MTTVNDHVSFLFVFAFIFTKFPLFFAVFLLFPRAALRRKGGVRNRRTRRRSIMSPCSFDFDEDRLMWSDSVELWAALRPCRRSSLVVGGCIRHGHFVCSRYLCQRKWRSLQDARTFLPPKIYDRNTPSLLQQGLRRAGTTKT